MGNNDSQEINTLKSEPQQTTKTGITSLESQQLPNDHIRNLLDAISSQTSILMSIKAEMTSMTAYDTAKEKVIDKLSEELKLYRDNFILQSQKPIFIELIMLYDNLVQTLNNLEENQKTTNDAYLTVKQNLHNIKEELLEILHRRDIIPFHEHPELLDYKLHKTVSTVTTSIESENNKVDTILKTGFRWNDKVIRAEEVVIKKYRKSP